MSGNKSVLKQKWEALSPRVRQVFTVGSVLVFFFGAVYSFVATDTSTTRVRRHIDRNDVQREVFTKTSSRDINLHALAATVSDLKKRNKDQEREINNLRNQIQVSPESRGVGKDVYAAIEAQAVAAAIAATEEKLTEQTRELNSRFAAKMATEAEAEAQDIQIKETSIPSVTVVAEDRPPTISDGMSPVDLSWGKQETASTVVGAKPPTSAVKKKETKKLRQITAPEDPMEKEIIAKRKEKKPSDVFIPAGSIFSGTLITGLDAPTGTAAKKSPFPTLLRIKKEAILPNRYRADVRECFLIASGYGDLSSERVYLRSETISCVRHDGGVIEAPIDMYAAGEDGKAGLRGQLDMKQGQYLAKAMAAGFMQSVASVFNEVPSTTISTVTGGKLPFQSVFSEEAAQSAAVQGVGDAMDRLANHYIDMAQSIFPIIQVDAGRQVDFIMTRGTALKLK